MKSKLRPTPVNSKKNIIEVPEKRTEKKQQGLTGGDIKILRLSKEEYNNYVAWLEF